MARMWRSESGLAELAALHGMPLKVLRERVANHVALLSALRFANGRQGGIHRLRESKGTQRRAVTWRAGAVEWSPPTDCARHTFAATEGSFKQGATFRSSSLAALKSCPRRKGDQGLGPFASLVFLGHGVLRLSTRANVERHHVIHGVDECVQRHSRAIQCFAAEAAQ